MSESRSWTRREALGILGMSMAAASLPEFASAAAPVFPRGAVIRTVLKDYAPDDLAGGATLFHEHMSFADNFMTRWGGYAADTRRENALPGAPPPGGAGPGAGRAGPPAAAPPPPPSTPSGTYFMQDLAFMVEEMRIARGDGISCIVDGGHADMGRDINFLRQVSEQSGLPIVAGAGFYTQPFYPKEIATMSEEQVYRALLRQVETEPVGCFGEIGSWDYITKDERKVFRAVGRASVATNLPIFTHTGIPGKSALEQLDLFEDVGVDPKKVVIGHLGNLTDANVEVHRAVARRGAFIGFDRQGGQGDTQQVPMVMKLLEAGYADNLMFASDLSNIAQTRKGGGPGYARTLTVFVPKLKAAGASDEVLRQIMNDNPRRFLAFVPKQPRKG
ncbi:MAG TPA: amidohydrolase family protein [Vicinamibacterales bacterium]|nr:amidohydrolase family protein [Vicinamibacterales bacterium]